MHFLFDLDGTITCEEILPRIAREIGLEKEIGELTRKTIAGEIPFEHSFRERVKILSSLPISTIRNIVAEVSLDPDIAGFIRNNASRCAIVTGNLDVWVSGLCETLGAKLYCSTAASKDDYITDLTHVLDKGKVAAHISEPFVAVGDGHNDRGMLEWSAVGIAFGGVHPPASSLLEVADYTIYNARRLCQFLAPLS